VTDRPDDAAGSAGGVIRPRIAVFAGPNATVLNSEPLVTSNKARTRARLPPRTQPDGTPIHFDALRPQRLAAPATVYVEQFSAHPLERDAADLYGPPDGFVDTTGSFHRDRTAPDDVPVYEVSLEPGDGLDPLPYMARQADGRPWEGDEADPFGPPGRHRQPFYPDASRVFEEIDRLGVGDDGIAAQLARLADFDFLRPAPPGGWTAEGEQRGRDYFPYRPVHLIRQPSRRTLARLTNAVHDAMASGSYDGGLWLEGSPYVEETAWWLNLLIDTQRPLAACASQRPHGALGNDGDRNILDAVTYLVSGAWAGDDGHDALGVVVVMDQLILSARAAQKADARPGGYVAAGGAGGLLGSISSIGRTVISTLPPQRHTSSSAVRMTRLHERVEGVSRPRGRPIERIPVRVLDERGGLEPDAVPVVTLVKHGQYIEESDEIDVSQEAAILARLGRALERQPLAGFVAEGSSPFGTLNESAEAALRLATFSGFPVVKVGRGNAGGVTEGVYSPFAIAGGTLTATKARLLLMACLLRFGALPPAADPSAPSAVEMGATRRALDTFQEVFDSH
jgi:L-asparaginase/Glu-tRNA(Gln) amidotransferase subunit D